MVYSLLAAMYGHPALNPTVLLQLEVMTTLNVLKLGDFHGFSFPSKHKKSSSHQVPRLATPFLFSLAACADRQDVLLQQVAQSPEARVRGKSGRIPRAFFFLVDEKRALKSEAGGCSGRAVFWVGLFTNTIPKQVWAKMMLGIPTLWQGWRTLVSSGVEPLCIFVWETQKAPSIGLGEFSWGPWAQRGHGCSERGPGYSDGDLCSNPPNRDTIQAPVVQFE